MNADSLSGLETRLAEALRGAVESLRAELRGELRGLRSELGLAAREAASMPELRTSQAPAPEVPAPELGRAQVGDDLDALLEAARGIDAAATQSALLAALLEGVGRTADRAFFWLAREDGLEGWAGLGFGEAAQSLAGRHLAAASGPLADCLSGGGTVALDGAQCGAIVGEPSGPAPREGLLVPFVLRGRVAGILYLDRADADPPLAVAAAQLLTHLAADALETLPLRAAPSPALRLAELAAPAVLGAAAAVPLAPDAASASAVRDVAPPLEVHEVAAAEAEAATAPSAAADVEGAALPEPATPPVSWQFETVAIDRRSFAAEEVEPPVPLQAAPAEAVEEPTVEVKPPPDLVGPGWAFTSPGTPRGEESKREEARRLARLLVTEIKLYNEEKVEEGRQRGNIYAALREDIDRSRRIFEERVAAEVRAEADYFQEELVRILAAGDSGTLGV